MLSVAKVQSPSTFVISLQYGFQSGPVEALDEEQQVCQIVNTLCVKCHACTHSQQSI